MSLLGKVAKGVGRLAGRALGTAIKSTPIGAAVATGVSLVRGGRQGPVSGPPALIPRGVGGPPGFQVPGWLPGPSFLGGGQRRVTPGPMGECPKGFHLNKTRTADGLPPRTFCTRNRSMNFANGRAAIRSGRRLRGTAKLLKRAIRFTSATPAKGRPIARGGRRK